MGRRKGSPKRAAAPKWNKRYGLAEEDHSTPLAPELTSLSEAFYDDVHGTAKSLQSLKEHSDFSRWLKNNKLNDGDLVTVERKLQLYQDLRVLDPDGFRRLLEVREGPSSLPCSITQYLNHYLFNSVATSLLLLTLVFTFSLIVRSLTLALIFWNLSCWAKGTSAYGAWQSLWLEEIKLNHRASPKASIFANVCEVAYIISTLGLGGLVSVGICFVSKTGQSLCERIFDVRLVHERQVGPELGESVGLGEAATERNVLGGSPERSTVSKVSSRGTSRRARK